MKNDKFLKNQRVELLRDCSDAPRVIPKGTHGIITNTYASGNIRIASNVGDNWRWEIYLHNDFKFSDTIKSVGNE